MKTKTKIRFDFIFSFVFILFLTFIFRFSIDFSLVFSFKFYHGTTDVSKNVTDSSKSRWLLLLKLHLKLVSTKEIFIREKEREKGKILFCVCFGFCSKIYAIVRSESQN